MSDSWPPALDARAHALDGGATMYHAIEYAIVEGFRPLQLDLYLPAPATEPTPAVVYIHGGGWSLGTRRRFGRAFKPWQPTAMERVAAAGFAIVSMDYRLSSESLFPAQLHDVKGALRWVRANAAQLNVDSDRVVAWGESAGGHLASLVGLTGDRLDLEGDVGPAGPSSAVSGVIAWYAPSDLRSMSAQRHPESTVAPESPDSTESRLIGAPLGQRPDLATLASPITYVHAGAPPFQLTHGTDDRLVPFGQSVQLAAALEQVGVPADLIPIEGADHFWIGAPSIDAIFESSLAFARRAVGR